MQKALLKEYVSCYFCQWGFVFDSACLFVCLFVCLSMSSIRQKSCRWISMQFLLEEGLGSRNNKILRWFGSGSRIFHYSTRCSLIKFQHYHHMQVFAGQLFFLKVFSLWVLSSLRVVQKSVSFGPPSTVQQQQRRSRMSVLVAYRMGQSDWSGHDVERTHKPSTVDREPGNHPP